MLRAAASALLLVLLAGCTATGTASPGTVQTSTGDTSPDALALTDDLARLEVSVLQHREDYSIRGLQIQVTNNGERTVTVESAEFTSDYFAEPVSAPSAPSRVFAGATTDFKIRLPDPNCDTDSDTNTNTNTDINTVEASVTLTISDEDTPGTGAESATFTPADPFGSLELVHAQDCSREAFEAVAAITVAEQLRVVDVAGQPVAQLDLTVTPTSAAGEVHLESIGSTVLLQQPEGELRELDLAFTATSEPHTVTLSFTPARCDPHVVAEDKVGTLLPFHVDAGAFTDATFTLPSSDEVKQQFYNYVALACGW